MLQATGPAVAERLFTRADTPTQNEPAGTRDRELIRDRLAGPVRPSGNRNSGEAASHIEAVRAATDTACLQLWRSVVLQILADIDAGLRVLRAKAAANPAIASTRRKTVREAHDAAMWLFGQQTRLERTWICSWIDIDPVRLQEAVRREHGSAVDLLLAQADTGGEADGTAGGGR